MKNSDLEGRLVYYSEAEELVNRLTHGAGALLSLIGVTFLIVMAAGQHDGYRVVSACIYGGAMVTFYCLSTAYHSVRRPHVRYVFRILDHASIYLMIAGSYTPFALVSMRGPWGWSLFGTVWGLGTVGAILKIYNTHRLRVVGPLLYIALGWIVVIAWKPLSAALATNGLTLLFAGGVAYTFGVIFYLWDRLPFNHAIWHFFVLTGSACHFFAIFYYVTPRLI
ncbi:PAQR family membrane homeostasis protein TrhA [Geomesophilobacter sediminis]|uniref:Hemolysin III family protein n=1 Tax=Geomesophilobacter sediminis TaxID=2798584 RepID=A0A8J7M3C5_9BACT|nr:hemolysin III family protein [Geomesophilobacter sediminis]MBJ6727948.1 hemolysin III family protein [Geomesophilobacter sediminis]